MYYLPPLRRFLLPSFICLIVLVIYKSSLSPATIYLPLQIFHSPPPPPPGARVRYPAFKQQLFNSASHAQSFNQTQLRHSQYVEPLFQCRLTPNRFTGHIRLPHPIYKISMAPAGSPDDIRVFWNPTIMALPYWSSNQFLLVSRIVTDGTYQENAICEANICHPATTSLRHDDRLCSPSDLAHLNGAPGLRCATPPLRLNVPPTPAKQCPGSMAHYASIPGFHDPRIFWSGRGEPLMILNTQSRYACFGLWLIDLRSLYPPLESLLASSPAFTSLGPLAAYPSLTELTRNPPESRGAMEKNWVLFGRGEDGFVSYELTPHTRMVAKLLGAGYTSPNLTDPAEVPCLFDDPALVTTGIDGKTHAPTWHQSTNSLTLVLCRRRDPACVLGAENMVFVAVVHRKHLNAYGLPLRYERYVVLWAAQPPFNMLGVSKHPLLFANETAAGWTAKQNWDDGHAEAPFGNYTLGRSGNGMLRKREGAKREMWASFTYTVSIAWAWDARNRVEVRDKNVGYLDDEVIVGIGIADGGQGFVQVPVRELVGCLRACPVR